MRSQCTFLAFSNGHYTGCDRIFTTVSGRTQHMQKPPCPYTYIYSQRRAPHSHHPFSSLSYPLRSCLYPLAFSNYTCTDIPCDCIIDYYITMDSSNKNTPSGTVHSSATIVNRVVGQSCLVRVCLFASRYCYAYAVCNIPIYIFNGIRCRRRI
jgi:hypothetical protein